MRPVLKWVGGKSGIAKEILALMSPFSGRFFEPFAGGAAIYFALPQGTTALISDLNPGLIITYNVIKDRLVALVERLRRHNEIYCGKDFFFREKYYYGVRSRFNQLLLSNSDNKVEIAAAFIFLNQTGFNGIFRANATGAFNVPFGKRKRPPILRERLLGTASRRLAHATIKIQHFSLALQQAQPGDFVYLDPPYDGGVYDGWVPGGFTRTHQKELATCCHILHQKGVKFIQSNAATPWVTETYQRYQMTQILAPRSIAANGQRDKVPEWLITNIDV